MKKYCNKKIIISGGGTGGHIFPAISIANALKEKDKEVDILFVGAKGRMEMDKVPAAGYNIVGLPVSGFQRKFSIQHISFFFKLLSSLIKSRKIINSFRPNAVIGVGGYASGPLLKVATKKRIPSLILEQNSYAGITNRLLSKKVNKICVAYDKMDKYFPKEKIILTGNPVRQDLKNIKDKKEKALRFFDLNENKKIILIIGGSLGAKTINQCVLNNIQKIVRYEIQLIWQTGKYYFEDAKIEVNNYNAENIKIHDFISRMDLAYAAADIIISRAGAGTVSELCLVGKPTILVPSPNVAEDHQTKNAKTLVDKNAAIMINDGEATRKLINRAIELLDNESEMKRLSENIAKMAVKDSAKIIANEILKMIKSN